MLCCGPCTKRKTKRDELDKILPKEFVCNDDVLNRKLKEYGETFEGKGPDDKACENLRKAYETNKALGDLRSAHDEKDGTKEDIYDRLGFGFTAYFRMLYNYTCLFVFFTILLLPCFYFYNKGGAF